MPQLDPTSFASQLFWLAVSFILLYLLASQLLLPRVQSVLSRRAGTLEGDIEQARRMKAEAERAADAYEKELARARAKAQEIIGQAHGEIAAQASKRQAELDAVLEKKLAESDVAIAKARKDVSDKLTPVAADLASLIVEVLVHQKPSSREVAGAISGLEKGNSL